MDSLAQRMTNCIRKWLKAQTLLFAPLVYTFTLLILNHNHEALRPLQAEEIRLCKLILDNEVKIVTKVWAYPQTIDFIL